MTELSREERGLAYSRYYCIQTVDLSHSSERVAAMAVDETRSAAGELPRESNIANAHRTHRH
jgi:hypothetical protein